MISVSKLSCYSAISSRILITNHLITFLTLHSHYPVLQPINTYYSLIGAVYVFMSGMSDKRNQSPDQIQEVQQKDLLGSSWSDRQGS